MAPEPSQTPATKVSDVVNNFRPSKLFKSPPGTAFTSIDFNDSGEFLLLARTDDTIQLYNTKAGAHAKEMKSQKYGNALARFTHHDTSILYASTKVDDGIRYLSMHDNSFIKYFRGHTDRVTSLVLNPGNDTFISAGLDNTVRLWDLRSTNQSGQLTFESPYLVAYDPSATVIAIASPPAQTILLYDLRNYDKPPFASFDLMDVERKYHASHNQPEAHGWTALEFSNNGKYVLLSTNGPGHYVLDAYDGKLIHYLHRPSGNTSHLAPGDQLSSNSPIQNTYVQGDASFSPDGLYVVSGNGGQSGLLVWEMEKKDVVLEPTVELPSSKPSAVVAYNPRYNLIASAEKECCLWVPDPELG
ncbi:WD repeat-containing protein-like protein [Polychaeton citri CBS 116435]|uniref:WD repeat-containing protein-like protein n=1 Tax=Polychaeton citri CBS 116435 TaxID=1314669 RepID=A0A9P4QFE0_9PEZI|nr:WD repeat-containing protein-like protein [Polychaeton citri CBS 116435]